MAAPEFYMGMRVKGVKPGSHEHMTVAYLGTDRPGADDLKVFDIAHLCTTGHVRGETKLGPHQDRPVWLIHMDDSTVINALFREFNVEQEHTRGLEEPLLHITKKHMGVVGGMGARVDFDAIFFKEVGATDPYYIMLL